MTLADPATMLRRMLDARSIAVVGASSDPKKVGHRPVDYLLRVGYSGKIYPVNPSTDRLGDLSCYPSLEALPEVPELVVVLVAAHKCEKVVSTAAELGVPSVLVISSGFGETDAEGAEMERRLGEIALANDMALIGPNSVGIIHSPNNLAATFTEALSRGPLTRPGGIGIVSQSGAFGTIIFALARDADLGLRTYVSTGNEATLGVADILAGMLEDPDIGVVGGYVEGVRDGSGLEHAARRARELGKPIILVKVGSSEAGRRAAQSHTGAIAGNEDVYDAAFKRLGIVRAEDEQHLLDVLDTFDIWYRVPTGRRVAVVSMSGGAGVLLCDDIVRRGLDVVEFPEPLVERLRDLLPTYASVRNPVDLTGQFVANSDGLQAVLEEVAHTSDVDAILLFAGIGWTGGGDWVNSVVAATETGAPIMVVTQLAPAGVLRALRAAGVPAFSSPIRASRVLGSVVEWTTRCDDDAVEPLRTHASLPVHVSEAEGKMILQAAGISIACGSIAASPEEAGAAAAALQGTVAVKALGRGLEHKTDLGAVAIGVERGDVTGVCKSMVRSIRKRAQSATIDGFLIEEMAPDGVDFAIGAVWEEPFGHLMMVGLGGTAVEVLGDVAFGLAPVGIAEADRMIRSLKAFPILNGHRGSPRLDVAALAEAVSVISRLVAGYGSTLAELDVNPIRVLPERQGVVALDALFVPSRAE